MSEIPFFFVVLGIFCVIALEDESINCTKSSDEGNYQPIYSPELPTYDAIIASGREDLDKDEFELNGSAVVDNDLSPTYFSSGEGLDLLKEAVSRAVQFADDLFDDFEPKLARKGFMLNENDPGFYVALLSKQRPEAWALERNATVALKATKVLGKQLEMSREQIRSSLQDLDVTNTVLGHSCSLTTSSCPFRNRLSRYRNLDGSCNNPLHPDWGKSLTIFRRLLRPDYADGVSEPRTSASGLGLPTARQVSATMSFTRAISTRETSLFLMQWGQILDHDLTRSALSSGFLGSRPRCCGIPERFRHPACFPIPVFPRDPFYGNFNVSCLEFIRSSAAPREQCRLGAREQLNQVTAYLDASSVYGSTLEDEKHLRAFQRGALKETSFGYRKPLLPSSASSGGRPGRDDCEDNADRLLCFRAGDVRVNEHPGLTAIHTLLVREHNRLASTLSRMNGHWPDQRIYQESRRIVGAVMQHITYREFLPILLGPIVTRIYKLSLTSSGYYEGYNVSTQPGIFNVFSAAAFRLGHSLVPDSLKRFSKDHHPINQAPESSTLHREFFRPAGMYNFGAVDRLLLGMINENAMAVDPHITPQLSGRLFQRPHGTPVGTDLFAINIQRGRDHGIAGYASWRRYCGLREIRTFLDLEGLMPENAIDKLQSLYRSVDDVDLYPAALSEYPVVEGMVGPTLACLVARQFRALKDGDRFWYENGGFPSSFSLEQLNEIRKSSLARLLCDNMDDVEELQRNAMEVARPRKNPRVRCDSQDIPSMDLSHWLD